MVASEVSVLTSAGPGIGGPYGPYRQSERTELYQEHANKLLESGHAYRCFCTSQRLHDLALQRTQLGLPTDYDRTCADIPKEIADDRAWKGEQHVIRLRAPEFYPSFHDNVYGILNNKPKQVVQSPVEAYDDPILLKSDGQPTYHLANVVDDHYMKITHVIRGTEWIPATPKHIELYNAFGWKPPLFSHVGLLVDEDRNKLSKRNMDVDIASYRNAGYYPETMTNYVALLGWSHSQKSDVMNLETLVKAFTPKFTRGNAIVTSNKLTYLQRQHAYDRFSERTRKDEKVNPKYVAERKKAVSALVSLIESNPGTYEGYRSVNPDLAQHCRNIFEKRWMVYDTPQSFLEDHDYLFKTPTVTHSSVPNYSSDPVLDSSVFSRKAMAPIVEELAKATVVKKDWNADTFSNIKSLFLNALLDRTYTSTSKLGSAIQDFERRAKTLNLDLEGYTIDTTAPASTEFEDLLVSSRPDPDGAHKQKIMKLCEPELARIEQRIDGAKMDLVDAHTKKLQKMLYWHMRQALAGGKSGPGMGETLELLGKDVSIERLERYFYAETDGEREEVGQSERTDDGTGESGGA